MYHTNLYPMKQKHGRIDSFWKVEDGHEYVCVILKATNLSNTDEHIWSDDFRLVNSNGESLETCIPIVEIWDQYDYLHGTTLASGGTKTGKLIFNNPNTDNSNLKLKLEESHWFSDNKVYEINLINN